MRLPGCQSTGGPMGMHGRASQRSSRRPSGARIGRDREMRISSAAPCAARGAPLQPKIGLPYQLYVSAPRAKFGGLGWRVGCGRRPVPKGGIVRNKPSLGIARNNLFLRSWFDPAWAAKSGFGPPEVMVSTSTRLEVPVYLVRASHVWTGDICASERYSPPATGVL